MQLSWHRQTSVLVQFRPIGSDVVGQRLHQYFIVTEKPATSGEDWMLNIEWDQPLTNMFVVEAG